MKLLGKALSLRSSPEGRFLKIALLCGISVFSLSACVDTRPDFDPDQRRAESMKADLETLRSALPEVDFSEPLKLNQVIKLALQNNLDLRVKKMQELIADSDAVEAKFKVLPRLDLNATTATRDKFDVHNQEGIDANDNLTGVTTVASSISEFKTTHKGSLSLAFDTLDLGISYIKARQSSLIAETVRQQRARQAQNLALDVTEAYWKAALAEDALDYVREVRRQVTRQHAALEAALDENSLNADSVKRLQRQLVGLELSVHDLRSDIAGARLDLARLMGIHPNSKFTLGRQAIKDLLKTFPKPQQLDTAALERYALLHRPELFERDLDVEVRRELVRASLLSMFPGLNFSLGANYDKNSLLRHNEWNSAAVSLSWNLLALPAQYQAWKSSKKGVTESEINRLAISEGVMAQTHLAILEYGIAVTRFKLNEQSYDLADEILEITRERRRAGKSSLLREAQDLIENMQTKLRRDQTVVDLIVANRRLLVAVGMDPLKWGESMFAQGLATTDAAKPTPVAPSELPEVPAN